MHFVRLLVRVEGIVQGVGFRPTVYRLANETGISGYVLNDPDGVEIEAIGFPNAVEAFLRRLEAEPPPLAQVDGIRIVARSELDRVPEEGFRIVASREGVSRSTLISADIASCPDCVREMLDPHDRRYRYPFLNCTNCGPRFTIIEDVPYDRPVTSMRKFPMCPACRAEYDDPLDRRFHAQPTCCPHCGPTLSLVDSNGTPVLDSWNAPAADGHERRHGTAAPTTSRSTSGADTGRGPSVSVEQDPAHMAVRLLATGRIVAVKGLGGFHLACDASNEEAVALLRHRKHREEKPLAVMAASTEAVSEFAHVSQDEAELLASRQRPIVLLRKRSPFPLAPSVAPRNGWIGAMLPYTPLHHLLLDGNAPVLVMTSGNLTDEPIAKDNDEALERLRGIADYFLLHDRDILVRADDSVVRLHDHDILVRADDSADRLDDCDVPVGADDSVRGDAGEPRVEGSGSESPAVRTVFLRRSRGFVPVPIDMGTPAPGVLALGGELKNTVCLTRGRHAFVSQHIGDLEDERTLSFFVETFKHLQKICDVNADSVVHDLHPEYLSTKYARGLSGVRLVGVQHHHAHVLSCMAEHKHRGAVIGIALDGTGYGPPSDHVDHARPTSKTRNGVDDQRAAQRPVTQVWGSEFLLVDGREYKRLAHFRPVPLPGNALAIRQPWRMALAFLHDALGRDEVLAANEALRRPRPAAGTSKATPGVAGAGAPSSPGLACVQQPLAGSLLDLLDRRHPFVTTCGAGRIFDAVSSLLDVRHVSSFEGQAAMELEMSASPDTGVPPFPFSLDGPGTDRPVQVADEPSTGGPIQIVDVPTSGRPVQIDFRPMFRALIHDLAGTPDRAVLAARVHVTVARAVIATARLLSEATGLRTVALSGGVFQNRILSALVEDGLTAEGLNVLTHSLVPPNDGGLSLGQAYYCTF